jgi:hypothetical protein
VKVFQVGLVVDQSRPWLAASPDGVIINTDGTPETLLEIKCPHLGKNAVFLNKYHCNIFCFIGRSMSVAEILEKKCPQYIKKQTNGDYILRKRHMYYAQVQMNLFILGLKTCSFMLYCSADKSFRIIKIGKDAEFFKKLETKLSYVFFSKMISTIYEKMKKINK